MPLQDFNDQNSEKKLLQKVAEGDEQAFRQLFLEYHSFLASHIFRIVESYELMEEIVQDIFLKIWLTRETLLQVDNFKGYLVVVSRNQALNALSRILRESKKKAGFILETSSLQVDSASPDENFQLSLLDQAINALPPRQQEVFLLHRHSRLTYQEIADKMGIGKETVKSQLKAAVNFVSVHIKKRIGILIILFELFKK